MTDPRDWRSEYYQMIYDIEQRVDKISTWEIDFIESIRDRLDAKKELTPRQLETLDAVWEKATKRG